MFDFEKTAENGNYTCNEIKHWLSTEKHYSNNKKDILFSLIKLKDCSEKPIILLKDIGYGWSVDKSKTFFDVNDDKTKKCNSHDEYAVAFLSNFSINNNFSHFLHALLRLFCSLIDARYLVWSSKANTFIKTKDYTIWLDEYFRLTTEKKIWIEALGGNIRSLSKFPSKGECISTNNLLYGSGCVKLLPPEKWFGYPGCRANKILPAFGHYMRQKFSALGSEELKIIDDFSNNYLRIAFAVRDVGTETGRRVISNLDSVQKLIKKTQYIKSSMENVTFEHLDVPSTVRYMAGF
jgi:hypothetical protein